MGSFLQDMNNSGGCGKSMQQAAHEYAITRYREIDEMTIQKRHNDLKQDNAHDYPFKAHLQNPDKISLNKTPLSTSIRNKGLFHSHDKHLAKSEGKGKQQRRLQVKPRSMMNVGQFDSDLKATYIVKHPGLFQIIDKQALLNRNEKVRKLLIKNKRQDEKTIATTHRMHMLQNELISQKILKEQK